MDLKKLKQVRRAKKVTLIQLAQETGLSRDRLSLIERGKVNPSYGTVVKILEAMGLRMAILSLDDIVLI